MAQEEPLAKSQGLHPSPWVRGIWGSLSSPTEPRREQGKEATLATQLFKNSGSGAKLPGENSGSEVKQGVSFSFHGKEEGQINAFYIKGTREAEPRESGPSKQGLRPLASY